MSQSDSQVVVTDAVVDAISQQLPDITTEQVGAVLTKWNEVLNGDALGTIRMDPDTGNVAYRVAQDGIHMWKVSAPDGGQWNDMQPTLPWTIVHQPTET
jgi:hypothetical protein